MAVDPSTVIYENARFVIVISSHSIDLLICIKQRLVDVQYSGELLDVVWAASEVSSR